MSWYRLLSSALVFSGFFIYGRLYAARSRDKLDCVCALIKETELFESRLGLMRAPLEELVRCATESGTNNAFWQRMALELEKGASPYEAYKRAEADICADDAKPILDELFLKLGSADAETEVKRLRAAKAGLTSVYGDLKQRLDKNTKLRSSLSFMMGLAAALIVL